MEKAEDRALAPLMPKPLPNGNGDLISTLIYLSVSFWMTDFTVGKSIFLVLKITSDLADLYAVTVTLLSIVQPIPIDPILNRFLSGQYLKIKLMLAGQ